ncbi:MAG: FixH family protein [Pseudonocardia sp.]
MTPRRVLVPVLVAAVVVAVVLLAPRPGTGAPVVLEAATQRHAVRLTIDTGDTGTGTWLVEVTDPAGGPVAAERVTVAPAMPQMGHAIAPSTATAEAPGRYRVAGARLPMPGQWVLTVTVRAAGTEERVTFPVRIAP